MNLHKPSPRSSSAPRLSPSPLDLLIRRSLLADVAGHKPAPVVRAAVLHHATQQQFARRPLAEQSLAAVLWFFDPPLMISDAAWEAILNLNMLPPMLVSAATFKGA
jgi:hypothetical protein